MMIKVQAVMKVLFFYRKKVHFQGYKVSSLLHLQQFFLISKVTAKSLFILETVLHLLLNSYMYYSSKV